MNVGDMMRLGLLANTWEYDIPRPVAEVTEAIRRLAGAKGSWLNNGMTGPSTFVIRRHRGSRFAAYVRLNGEILPGLAEQRTLLRIELRADVSMWVLAAFGLACTVACFFIPREPPLPLLMRGLVAFLCLIGAAAPLGLASGYKEAMKGDFEADLGLPASGEPVRHRVAFSQF